MATGGQILGQMSLAVQEYSPVKSGKDRHGWDLIIGKPEMLKLGLVWSKSGHLCNIKRRMRKWLHLECTYTSHTAAFPTLDMTGFEAHIARLPEASFLSAPATASAQGAATASSKPVPWHKARPSTYAMLVKDLGCNSKTPFEFLFKLLYCNSFNEVYGLGPNHC